ncbi:MAG TPA: diacylglycerol kinase family protein, partial [Vicinamibacterales bacterium]|nr:diacylglycerol kinase family protein [Vicinamibacterales bacterium]
MPRIVRIPVNVFAIVNPFSGAGMDPAVSERRVELLRAELKRRSIEGAVQLTRHPGHARELAASAASARVPLVIVWGGDGTVNEAGSALVGTRSALALIPAGSGNGLAAALAVPRDPEAAIATAIDAEPRPIDVGFVNDRAFFNVAGIGFDAHIARLFNLRSRGARGRWPYISIGVREGCRYRGLDYDLDLEGEHFHLQALLIAFANGPEYGMGARI